MQLEEHNKIMLLWLKLLAFEDETNDEFHEHGIHPVV